MSNKEQSSVEWLVEVVSKMGYVSTEILEQAKAMHKEETCQFVSDYLDDAADYTIAEEYYDQIYGGKYTISNLDNDKYKDYSVSKEEPKQKIFREAAEEYYNNNIFCDGITEFEHDIAIRCYIAGVKSDVAKDYWFEQFKKK